MITHNLQQGTPEWHAFRAAHFTASDAPAMMGESPYKARNELLREKATGVSAEVDSATQRRFDDGHRFEALARPLAEEIIGAELYPVVGSEGKLAASFDGLTMLEDICFEHKTLNDDIRACKTADELPLHYRIQMEQQLMVSGADKCLFMATKWDGDDQLVGDPFARWYESDPALRQRIADGWAQFEKDLEAYQHVEAKPEVAGRAPDALPALRIEVSGAVTASNLAEFKARALEVFGNIKTDLETDEDFANADKTTKWCKEVEDRLEAAKQHALSQTASIDELFRTVDAIKEEARQKRLTLEKLVKQRKESIRVEKVEAARKLFLAHVAALQAEITGVHLVIAQPDFGGAIKGLKTLDSIQNALDTTLATAKIDADAYAKDMREKLAWCRENAAGHSALFPDLQQIIVKPMEDFALTISSRIEQHKKAEADRLEAERERIRQEEAAKLAAPQQAAQPAPAPALQQVAEVAQPVSPAPVQAVASSAPRSAPTLKLGAIHDRLGFTVTADFLRSLGFAPHAEGAAKLYHEEDFPLICRAIVQHVEAVAVHQLKRAA
ncbi:MAG: YqaJ viral recombinase family protein [Burkholderia sp.]